MTVSEKDLQKSGLNPEEYQDLIRDLDAISSTLKDKDGQWLYWDITNMHEGAMVRLENADEYSHLEEKIGMIVELFFMGNCKRWQCVVLWSCGDVNKFYRISDVTYNRGAIVNRLVKV